MAGDVSLNAGPKVILNNQVDNPKECEQCPKLSKKIEALAKDKASLNDKSIELNEKIAKLDKFYKSQLEQKDQIIGIYTQIDEAFDDKETKFKRMLSYHKAIAELKHMEQLRDYLLDHNISEVQENAATKIEKQEKVENESNTPVLKELDSSISACDMNHGSVSAEGAETVMENPTTKTEKQEKVVPITSCLQPI